MHELINNIINNSSVDVQIYLEKKNQIDIFLNKLYDVNPRDYGKPLKGQWQGCWRYRVGDYRIIAEILDNKFIVEIIKIAHRSEVYDI